jgi:hypothetical protein
MTILHVDTGHEMRGGQYQVLHLLKSLGARATLLTPAASPLMTAAQMVGLDARPFTLTSLAALSRQYDLIHAHDARAHTWVVTLGNAPVVVARRVAFAVKNSPLSQWKYRRARHYLAVSQFVRETLLDASIPADRISVVYDGVELPAVLGRGEMILAPATADPMKGTSLLQEAAAIGGFGVEYSENLVADLQRAAILVYITRSEGLGSAALLAMAAGVPVVASRVGGLTEIVQDGVTGVLTENTAEAIAAAVHRALAMRGELGVNARLRVEERFTAGRMVEDTVRVYEKVLGC